MLKNRLFMPESSLFKAKKLSKFIVIGPKIIDNYTGNDKLSIANTSSEAGFVDNVIHV
jgi:hypothetical protein